MISLDISVLYQIVLFLILWVILSKVLFQPYLRLLEERERSTTGAEQDSADLERQGARLRAKYEEKIAQAQAAGYAAKDEVLRDAHEQREKILTQARAEATRTLEQVRREVAAALAHDRQLAATEAAAVAGDMVSKALGRKVA